MKGLFYYNNYFFNIAKGIYRAIDRHIYRLMYEIYLIYGNDLRFPRIHEDFTSSIYHQHHDNNIHCFERLCHSYFYPEAIMEG